MAEDPLVQAVLGAYREGYFPMADPARPGELFWFNPPARGVIPLRAEEGLHIPRRLRERARSGRFRMTTDEAFEGVIRGCAEPRLASPDSWIDEQIVEIYTRLHRAGHAHSVEAWLDDPAHPVLVGGLYGVHLGAAFFAESKFSRPAQGGTDASKVCLYYLIAHLRRRGFTLLDVQYWNPHLEQFGCRELPRRRYLSLLGEAVLREAPWLPFEPVADL
jgi:leucyl/phenylalanyl-tRNA---protein transferase